MRCVWRPGTLSLADVDARWIAIAYESTKLDGYPTLSNLWKKWLSQEWNEPCHRIFGDLKSKLSSSPVLKFMEFDKPFEVHTGATDFAIKIVDVRWMAIAYGNMKLDDYQRRQPTNKKELLCHSALFENVATLFGVA